jgi:hypothetical protein
VYPENQTQETTLCVKGKLYAFVEEAKDSPILEKEGFKCVTKNLKYSEYLKIKKLAERGQVFPIPVK